MTEKKKESPATEKVVAGDVGLQNMAELTKRLLSVDKADVPTTSRKKPRHG